MMDVIVVSCSYQRLVSCNECRRILSVGGYYMAIVKEGKQYPLVESLTCRGCGTIKEMAIVLFSNEAEAEQVAASLRQQQLVTV